MVDNGNNGCNRILSYLFKTLMILYPFIIFGAVFVFLIGFHNVDLAYNMDELQHDTGSDNVIRSKFELYNLGTNQMIYSFIFSVFSSFLVIIYLMVNGMIE
jgi:hypothetical protein